MQPRRNRRPVSEAMQRPDFVVKSNKTSDEASGASGGGCAPNRFLRSGGARGYIPAARKKLPLPVDGSRPHERTQRRALDELAERPAHRACIGTYIDLRTVRGLVCLARSLNDTSIHVRPNRRHAAHLVAARAAVQHQHAALAGPAMMLPSTVIADSTARTVIRDECATAPVGEHAAVDVSGRSRNIGDEHRACAGHATHEGSAGDVHVGFLETRDDHAQHSADNRQLGRAALFVVFNVSASSRTRRDRGVAARAPGCMQCRRALSSVARHERSA